MSLNAIRIMGIDPGLQKTGWGIIDVDGNRLKHVANGIIRTQAKGALSERLLQISNGLEDVLNLWKPDQSAVEETFVNKNPASSLKLGAARGVALLMPAKCGVSVAEYAANLIKKSIVGSGHADKNQIAVMVKVLLPGVVVEGEDAADALAIAICHAHHGATKQRLKNLALETA